MKYGFIGCGKMASALVQGAIESEALTKEQILLSDAVPEASARLARDAGGVVAESNQAMVQQCDVIVLCVKPDDALQALRELGQALSGKLLISIVAGLTIESLQTAAGSGVRIVRVMPNTPALIRRGATVFARGASATEADATETERLFGAVGIVFEMKESLLNVVTGLSGSGPAFVYMVIEALADGGVLMGLPRGCAIELAAQTVSGAAEMILETAQHPAVLRDMVASPGGTTIAGLEALEQGGLRAALMSAVRAATERSRELGSKEK